MSASVGSLGRASVCAHLCRLHVLIQKGLILKEDAKHQWENPPGNCVRVLAGICSSTTSVFAFAVSQKGADAEGLAAKNFVDNILWIGHARAALRSDNEPATL